MNETNDCCDQANYQELDSLPFWGLAPETRMNENKNQSLNFFLSNKISKMLVMSV